MRSVFPTTGAARCTAGAADDTGGNQDRTGRPRLGDFSRTLLASLDRLAGDVDAQTLLLDMERVLGRRIAQPQIYTTLPKLIKAGLVKAVEMPPEPRQGGRRKRAFSLTDEGLALLEDARSAIMR